MADPFTIIIERMVSLGFYRFLFPFIITSALLFALLKKSKILGESVQINGILSLSIAFLIFGYPILAGISLETQFATFFTQATVWILVFVFAMLIASFFYPDLTGFLGKVMTSRTMLSVGIALGVVLMITSGLVTVFSGSLTQEPKPGAPPSPPADVVLVSSAVIIFVVIILIASSIYTIRK